MSPMPAPKSQMDEKSPFDPLLCSNLTSGIYCIFAAYRGLSSGPDSVPGVWDAYGGAGCKKSFKFPGAHQADFTSGS